MIQSRQRRRVGVSFHDPQAEGRAEEDRKRRRTSSSRKDSDSVTRSSISASNRGSLSSTILAMSSSISTQGSGGSSFSVPIAEQLPPKEDGKDDCSARRDRPRRSSTRFSFPSLSSQGSLLNSQNFSEMMLEDRLTEVSSDCGDSVPATSPVTIGNGMSTTGKDNNVVLGAEDGSNNESTVRFFIASRESDL